MKLTRTPGLVAPTGGVTWKSANEDSVGPPPEGQPDADPRTPLARRYEESNACAARLRDVLRARTKHVGVEADPMEKLDLVLDGAALSELRASAALRDSCSASLVSEDALLLMYQHCVVEAVVDQLATASSHPAANRVRAVSGTSEALFSTCVRTNTWKHAT